jgi:sulfite exporter TauE/SafE
MNWSDLSVVFGLSVVASLHCAQMCGPIVVSLGLTDPARSSCAAYNAGRVATYTALGALAGLIGKSFTALGRLAGIEEAAALICGVLMVIAGIIMFGALRSPQLVQIAPIRRAGRLLNRPGVAARFGLGTLLGFLPCGLIYAALLKSMSAGSATAGAMNMLVFGLGTSVPLLALGLFSNTLLRWFGKHSAPLAATGVTVMGAALIWRGLKPICLMHLQ